MDPRELALEAAKIADENKATDIEIIQVGKLTDSFDYFVIGTCSNDKLVDKVIDEIENDLRDNYKIRPISVEGRQEATWELIDFGSVLVHIFQPEARDYYRLETLWGDAPRVEFQPTE